MWISLTPRDFTISPPPIKHRLFFDDMIISMNPKWRVIYYVSPEGNNPVKAFLDGLTKQAQSKLLRIFDHIEEYGLQSVIRHIKKVSGTPFWEIRILGQDNVRLIYVIPTLFCILVLHGFTKKTQKAPLKELKIVSKRYQQYLLSIKSP